MAGIALVVMLAPLWRIARPPRPDETTAPAPTPADDSAPLSRARTAAGAASAVAAATREAADYRAQAAKLRSQARYPEWTTPLDPATPLLPMDQPPYPPQLRRPPREGEPPTLGIVPALFRMESPNPLVVHAFVLDASDRWLVPTALHGTLRDDRRGTTQPLVFRDDGTASDAGAGDALYTAEILPPTDLAGETSYTALVSAELAGGTTLTANRGFVYAVVSTRTTGRYRDAAVDGHLVLQVEIDAAAAGTAALAGWLVLLDGTPLGTARTRADLHAGRQEVPLVFYGLLFRDRNVGGPFLLHHVMLESTPGGAHYASPDYRTAAYPVTAFTEFPFQHPRVIGLAENLETRAERLAPATPGPRAG